MEEVSLKYRCNVCNVFEYEIERGNSLTKIKPGTEPEDFPESWQCPICHADKTHLKPVGVTTHNPELRARLKVEWSAKKLENFLHISTEELKDFARLTGHEDVHKLTIRDLCTVNSEISNYTEIEHV